MKSFEIVYGGITALQDGSFGNITLALSGSDAASTQLIAELRAAPRPRSTRMDADDAATR